VRFNDEFFFIFPSPFYGEGRFYEDSINYRSLPRSAVASTPFIPIILVIDIISVTHIDTSDSLHFTLSFFDILSTETRCYYVPSGELQPRDRVGSWLFHDELHGDSPDRVLSRRDRFAADGPTVAEHLHHLVPQVSGFRAHRHANRRARVHDDAILGRALRAVRYDHSVHFYV
jgi:hypothetical protein